MNAKDCDHSYNRELTTMYGRRESPPLARWCENCGAVALSKLYGSEWMWEPWLLPETRKKEES